MCLVATRRRRKSETSHSSEVINSCVTARVARPAETLMDLVTFCQDSDFPFVSFPQARVLSDSWMLANHSHSRFWSSLSLFFFVWICSLLQAGRQCWRLRWLVPANGKEGTRWLVAIVQLHLRLHKDMKSLSVSALREKQQLCFLVSTWLPFPVPAVSLSCKWMDHSVAQSSLAPVSK